MKSIDELTNEQEDDALTEKIRLNPSIASVLVNYEDCYGKKKGRELWNMLVEGIGDFIIKYNK